MVVRYVLSKRRFMRDKLLAAIVID